MSTTPLPLEDLQDVLAAHADEAQRARWDSYQQGRAAILGWR